MTKSITFCFKNRFCFRVVVRNYWGYPKWASQSEDDWSLRYKLKINGDKKVYSIAIDRSDSATNTLKRALGLFARCYRVNS